jgi:hypothetical protein
MKKWFVIASLLLAALPAGVLIWGGPASPPAVAAEDMCDPIPMPKVDNDPFATMAWGGVPQEQREEWTRRWLAVSVKIQVANSSGSGTIVYYNRQDGWAYVQSCGHLWGGNMSAEQGQARRLTCKVVTWYQNEKKLPQPVSYQAEVLFYSNTSGFDSSLVRFKPDWDATYMPIAPADFKLAEGVRLHSCGCDGGREVAHYDVRFLSYSGEDIVTTENSPRRGRSGGGLMTDDMFVGVCSRSSDPDGTIGKGNGYFTGLRAVRYNNERNGYGWLNDGATNWARRIPIIDRNSPQRVYPKDYIPLPQGR